VRFGEVFDLMTTPTTKNHSLFPSPQLVCLLVWLVLEESMIASTNRLH
jgi:hypothetical protein